MTDEQYTITLQIGNAIKAKNELLISHIFLTDSEKCELINKLITFENSHIIANCFNDDSVAYSLYQELKTKYE